MNLHLLLQIGFQRFSPLQSHLEIVCRYVFMPTKIKLKVFFYIKNFGSTWRWILCSPRSNCCPNHYQELNLELPELEDSLAI